MAPTFLPQAKPSFPGNADVSKQLTLLGDTIGQAVRQHNRMKLLADVIPQAGGAASVPDMDQAAFKLLASGEPQLAAAISQMSQQKFQRGVTGQQLGMQQQRLTLAEKEAGAQQQYRNAQLGLSREQFKADREYKNATLGLKRLETAHKMQGGFKDIKERAGVESGLRKEYTKLSDDFLKVRDAFGRIQASAQNPSAAGDLALIFNYMKVLDPGSTVREGEFATAQNAAGIPARIVAQYNKVLNGERLATEQRKDFVDRAGKLYKSQATLHNKLTDQFKQIGTRLGVDVMNVTPDFSPSQEPQTQQQSGEVIDYTDYFGKK